MTAARTTPGGGLGNVGLGDPGSPSPRRKRPDLCAEQGHPGVTFNPWIGKTWCLCGEVVRDGDCATHAACCGGPLEEAVTADHCHGCPFRGCAGCRYQGGVDPAKPFEQQAFFGQSGYNRGGPEGAATPRGLSPTEAAKPTGRTRIT